MPLDEKVLEAFRDQRRKAHEGGGKSKIESRHQKGLMTARERLLHLFEPGTFQEIGTYIKHQCTAFDMERQVFLLKHIEGWTYDELSRLLGVPRGTVMSRLYVARQRLLALLSGETS